MQIAFVLDIIIAVLLVLTITYAVRLNQRLSQLRKDKNELQELAKTFADATNKAEEGIQQLKVSTDSLSTEVKKAEILRDDLAYLVDRGGRTADEMAEDMRKPKALREEALASDDEDRLIEEAIRAATPSAPRDAPARKPMGKGGAGVQTPGLGPNSAKGGRKDGSVLKHLAARAGAGAPARRSGGHPEPVPPLSPQPLASTSPASTPPASTPAMGGGLGGLAPEDRLMDDRLHQADEPKTVGDTDAARELLKALSAVK